MKIEEFISIFNDYLDELNIKLDEEQMKKFYTYMKLLIEWNEKMNLTAITKEQEIILKHFVDSLTIAKYIKDDASVIDVGTGAGFPGIPLKIYKKNIKITLVDSLNKRLKFLKEVVNEIKLEDVEIVHARAEELGKNKDYREKFNIATSRAVANLATLSEYLLPFVEVNGRCISMKGVEVDNELNDSKKAIEILGGKVVDKSNFKLPKSDLGRCLIIIEKIKNTPSKYPRKPGIPAKEPIV